MEQQNPCQHYYTHQEKDENEIYSPFRDTDGKYIPLIRATKNEGNLDICCMKGLLNYHQQRLQKKLIEKSLEQLQKKLFEKCLEKKKLKRLKASIRKNRKTLWKMNATFHL